MAEKTISKRDKANALFGAAILAAVVIGAFDFTERILLTEGADKTGLLIYPAIIFVAAAAIGYRKTRE